MASKRLSGCAWWRRRYWVGARNQSSHGRLTGRRQSSWIKNVWLTKASQNKETKRKEIERVDTSMGQSHHIQSQLLDIHLAIHRIHPSWYISIKHVHIEIDECQSQRDEKELHRKSFTSRFSLYIAVCSVVDRRLLFAISSSSSSFFDSFSYFLYACVCVCVLFDVTQSMTKSSVSTQCRLCSAWLRDPTEAVGEQSETARAEGNTFLSSTRTKQQHYQRIVRKTRRQATDYFFNVIASATVNSQITKD